MAFRKFNTGTWHDPDFEKLDPLPRYLFIYLWTNEYCNQAGIYEITTRRISFETKIPIEEVEGMLNPPSTGLRWYAKKEVVWVVNFLKHQCQNKEFFLGAFEIAKTYPEIIQDFININNCLFKKYNVKPDFTLEPPLKGSANADTNVEHNNIYTVSASVSEGVEGEDFIFSKKVPLPKNFRLTDQMKKYATDKNILIDLENFTEGFIIACKQHGYKYKNWYAAWQTWLRSKWEKEKPKYMSQQSTDYVPESERVYTDDPV